MTATFHGPTRIEEPLLTFGGNLEDRVALLDGDREVGYGELARRALAFAAALERHGVAPGDRVALYLDKSIDAVVAFYGALAAGAVAVPVGEVLKSPQVAHILRHSGSRVLVTDPRKAARLDRSALEGVALMEVTARRADTPRALGALRGGAEPAVILYTSGSTGRAKGILVSHDNLIAGARIVSRYLAITPDERIASVLPFSFDYGLNQLLCAVQNGAALVLSRSHLPADICRTLARHRVTGLAGVPPLWVQLLGRGSPLPRMSLPHLRYITNSGGVFPVDLVRRYRDHLPHVQVFLMYGLSEAFRSSYLPPSELERRPESMGRAIPETELLVLDEGGRPCAPGELGELVHRGPTVALGYHDDPEATARVFRPDPDDPAAPPVVYSGDIVRRDEEGFLYFCGRRDQMIKSYGYRVSPEEVEELLLGSGMVAEAVVHGRPDALAGARIVAHLVPRDPSAFELPALLAYCRGAMPRYMIPVETRVHDALPRTASGKLDRAAIRAAWEAP